MRIVSANVTSILYFVAVDPDDLITRVTGLSSFTVYRSRNGGAATVMTTPTVTEVSSSNMPGVYKLLVDEDTTIDSGFDSQEMIFHISAVSGSPQSVAMAPVNRIVEIYRAKSTAGTTANVSSGGRIEANVEEVLDNQLQTSGSTATNWGKAP